MNFSMQSRHVFSIESPESPEARWRNSSSAASELCTLEFTRTWNSRVPLEEDDEDAEEEDAEEEDAEEEGPDSASISKRSVSRYFDVILFLETMGTE